MSFWEVRIPRHCTILRKQLTFVFSCWHVYRWCFRLSAHPASVELSGVNRSIATRVSKGRLRPQASSPDIRQTEIHRPRSLGASFHGHEKLKDAPPNGPMADQAGNKSVPRFHQNLYERITRLWLFSAFPSNQRDDVLTALSVSRSEKRAGAGADRNTDKENPTHSFTNLFADTASTRREGRCVVRVSC